jgi:preprotein translocase subunit SecF
MADVFIGGEMFQLIPKTHIDFMKWKNVSFAISAVLIALGIVGLVQIGRGKANLGIDFVGGATIQLIFKQPVAIDKGRAALEKSGFPGASIQEVGEGGNQVLIRLREAEGASDKVQAVFCREFPENAFDVYSITEIGPAIGQALQRDTLVAIAISIVAIIIYIAFRFQFKFGVVAAIATMHDVLAVLGIFHLLDKELNLLVITALLTLAGYSLTDTVVIFDRIRENLRLNKRDPLPNVVNDSINEVLSRSVITSLTVVLVLIPLVFWGGEVLHDFSVALLLGAVVGSLSSIFVASPLLVVWQEWSGGKLIGK